MCLRRCWDSGRTAQEIFTDSTKIIRFFGQWKDEEQDVLGVYALSSDGEYTALAMQFANDDGTYDDEKYGSLSGTGK